MPQALVLKLIGFELTIDLFSYKCNGITESSGEDEDEDEDGAWHE
ncbi:hypothetical protein VCHA35P150_120077 [Vibrio chagasii]|nr:hypothetical protein VCHA35P150_120077 [Vibrio chagasii]CAH7308337.1 hypothetical protein VCHA43P275_60074 [Vibrio chagasii]CAH7408037.1 hypothetical protein VCHA53O473_60215 [Vibrio chagasii]